MTAPQRNFVDLQVSRRNTRIFVDYDASDVVLTRNKRVRTPSGGYTTQADGQRAPQRFRLITLATGLAPNDQVLEGETVYLTESLIGYPDLQVERGDTFTEYDKLWVVVRVDDDRKIRTAAQIKWIKSMAEVTALFGDPE